MAATGAAVAATAFGAGTAQAATINACYNNTSFALQYLKSGTCPSGTTEVSWNQTGPQGPQGARGMNFRGTWSSTISYAVGDAVEYGGSTWYAKVANTDSQPAFSNLNWALVALAGAQGAKGAPGPQGAAGTQGAKGGAGCAGITRRDWRSGCSGASRRDGRGGVAGRTGCAGRSGSPGREGSERRAGEPGVAGSAGCTGCTGASTPGVARVPHITGYARPRIIIRWMGDRRCPGGSVGKLRGQRDRADKRLRCRRVSGCGWELGKSQPERRRLVLVQLDALDAGRRCWLPST